MQTFCQHLEFYPLFKTLNGLSMLAQEQWHKLLWYEKLHDEGISQATAQGAIRCSRGTYYRWQQRYQQHRPLGLNARSHLS